MNSPDLRFLNGEQLASELAAHFFTRIRAIYVFGSVGRGETENARDVDLCVEYVDELHEDELVKSFTDFHAPRAEEAVGHGWRLGCNLV